MGTYRKFKIVIRCEVESANAAEIIPGVCRLDWIVVEVGGHTEQEAVTSFTQHLQEFIKEKENT